MIIGSIIASITDIICVSAATEQFGYQGMGMIVVFTCLSFLAIMISISGTVAQKMTNAKKPRKRPSPQHKRPLRPQLLPPSPYSPRPEAMQRK